MVLRGGGIIYARPAGCAVSPIGGKNSQKIFGLKARTTDKRAVNIGHRHQFRGVGRLYRTAVKQAELLAIAETVRQLPANETVDFAHFFRSRRAAGTDGPDRFVSHDQIGCRHTVGDRTCDLVPDNFERFARITLGFGFPIADLGCTAVIVGHSERRTDHGETMAQTGS